MSRIKWISPSRVFLYSSCYSLRWRHNGRDSVSNHHPHDCLLNRLFRRRSKKTSNLMVSPKISCAKKNMNKQSIKSKWLSTYSLWICRFMYKAHGMKSFPVSLALCVVTGGFLSQIVGDGDLWYLFVASLNKLLSKRWRLLCYSDPVLVTFLWEPPVIIWELDTLVSPIAPEGHFHNLR